MDGSAATLGGVHYQVVLIGEAARFEPHHLHPPQPISSGQCQVAELGVAEELLSQGYHAASQQRCGWGWNF